MSLKIYYWSPLISKIATARAVINSAISLKTNSNIYDCVVINSIGEFSSYQRELQDYKIRTYNFFNYSFFNILPQNGFFASRLSFFIIFCLSFFKLKKLLSDKKPDYLIIHLITSLPLFLNLIYDFDTKFILRISGLPKLNFIRKFFWKIAIKKVHHVTCPTNETMVFLIKNKIIKKNKISVLKDPVINPNFIKKNKSEIHKYKKKYKNFIFCAGRLTKQKNFSLIVKSFSHIMRKIDNLNLVIAGEGEERKKLIKLINKLKLSQRVFLIGHKKNIYNFFFSCKIFCLPSLWEDPGFVLIEAAYCNANIVSSNCPNGPKDFFKNLKYKYNFHSDNLEELNQKILKVISSKYRIPEQDKKVLFHRSAEYTALNHFKKLKNLLIPN